MSAPTMTTCENFGLGPVRRADCGSPVMREPLTSQDAMFAASAPSAPRVRQRTSDECASAPIGRTAHTHPEAGQCAAAHSDDQWALDGPR